MRFRTSHSPIFLKIADEFAAAINKCPIFKEKDSLVVFTCGAATTSEYKAKRDYLIEYSKRHFPEASFFRAEDVFSVLAEGSDRDLLSIERDLAEFSDCVLIVVESPGACAELGAFANDNVLVEKLLIVNDISHRSGTSFISKGPIAKADKFSQFRPTIYVDLPKITLVADSICDRIRRTIVRKRRKRINLSSYSDYTLIDAKDRLLFLLDLISLFSPVNRDELLLLLKRVYGKGSFEIDTYVGLLCAMQLLRVSGNKFFLRAGNDYRYSFEYTGVDLLALRCSVVNFYSKYCKERLIVLNERAADNGWVD